MKKVISCETCKSKFEGYINKTSKRKFCSRKCFFITNSKNQVGKTFSIETLKKMSLARIGKEPWNKGIKWDLMKGNKNAFRKNSTAISTGNWRARQMTKHIKKCNRCGIKKDLVTHHIDENVFHNIMSNLEKLCRKCHINHHRDKLMNAKL